MNVLQIASQVPDVVEQTFTCKPYRLCDDNDRGHWELNAGDFDLLYGSGRWYHCIGAWDLCEPDEFLRRMDLKNPMDIPYGLRHGAVGLFPSKAMAQEDAESIIGRERFAQEGGSGLFISTIYDEEAYVLVKAATILEMADILRSIATAQTKRRRLKFNDVILPANAKEAVVAVRPQRETNQR